ncbi:transmembrane sensor [Agrobacterium larrymoorei]|uniref:Transmembrane sensor n=1 Tax=Agrobacterium larrymoorei TaxID=160699 RepID=A0AAJ2B6H0_9HYPH|nr:FecR family protein [Agrobacterium larrymoorei]MDR6101263.1 transmembrane sensor [Agrobacterium larrymoorei]
MSNHPNLNGNAEEEAVDWLLELRDRPDDEELQKDFEAWVAGDEANAKAYERLRCLVGDAKRLSARESGFEFPPKSKQRSRTILPSIIVLLGIAAGSYFYVTDAFIDLRADRVTKIAEQASFTAPDGSTLVLNANSAIAFRFSQHERRVVLMRGEILVDVASDPKRPFVVEASGATITALGTAFDVNMLETETKVAVVRHSVAVRLSGEDQMQVVRENQGVNYASASGMSDVFPINPQSVTEWQSGRLVFEDQPVTVVIETVSRYVPGKILVANGQLRSKMVSGSLDMSDPDKALQSFAKAFDIKLLKVTPYLTILR